MSPDKSGQCLCADGNLSPDMSAQCLSLDSMAPDAPGQCLSPDASGREFICGPVQTGVCLWMCPSVFVSECVWAVFVSGHIWVVFVAGRVWVGFVSVSSTKVHE